jgi:hypothetical protein
MLTFSVNNFLELRLEDDKTNIYVNNELFFQCKYLLLNFSLNEVGDFEDGKDINDIVEKLDKSLEFSNRLDCTISPETQFWGHCSNLQTWYENNYSSGLIHRNLAFPLLKKLTEAGDYLANKVFKEEIAEKFESGHINTIKFLLYDGYFDYLEKIELDYIFEQSSFNLVDNLQNFRLINDLLDLVCFIDLNYYRNFLIGIFQRFPPQFRLQFARFTLLHLNYKEFRDYKIPYGRFYCYFEQIITYLFENYACMHELVNIIDSGYYYSSLSLDDKLAYGAVSFD